MAFRPDRLRAAREKRGMTQRELGNLLGVGVNQISRYEIGLNDPSAVMLTALCEHLNVSADYLLGLSNIPQTYGGEKLRPEETQLLDAFNSGDAVTVVTLLSDRIRQLAAEQRERGEGQEQQEQ